MLATLATPATPQPKAKLQLVTAANPVKWLHIAGKARRTPLTTEIQALALPTLEYLAPWKKTNEKRNLMGVEWTTQKSSKSCSKMLQLKTWLCKKVNIFIPLVHITTEGALLE